jgi:hypothetical protein
MYSEYHESWPVLLAFNGGIRGICWDINGTMEDLGEF